MKLKLVSLCVLGGGGGGVCLSIYVCKVCVCAWTLVLHSILCVCLFVCGCVGVPREVFSHESITVLLYYVNLFPYFKLVYVTSLCCYGNMSLLNVPLYVFRTSKKLVPRSNTVIFGCEIG